MAPLPSHTVEPPLADVEALPNAVARDGRTGGAFVSGHGLAAGVIWLLALTVALSLFHLGLLYAQIHRLSRMPAGTLLARADAFGTWQTALAIGETVVLLVTAVLFLWWVYRVRRNLSALGVRGLQFSPRWAVAGFLIPLLNLIVPVRALEEIWRASDPKVLDGDSWRKRRASWLIEWGWGAFLLAQLLDKFTVRAALASGHGASDLLFISWITVVSEVLGSVAAIMAIFIVRGVQSRQEAKRARLAEPRLPQAQLVPG